MTESSLDPEVVKRTQDSLGKFVKKPPLTEKLLRKPPFKFIHDVIKVVRAAEKRISSEGFIDVLSIQRCYFCFPFGSNNQ
jgi:Microtubule-binding protein MIP-T3 CH-like domain